MTDLCKKCMTWHPMPECKHDADRPCVRCKLPVGYLWTADEPVEPGVCWYCDAASRSLGVGDLTTKVGNERRSEARFLVRGVKPMVLDSVRRNEDRIEGRLRVGTAETTVRLGPDGYTGSIVIEGYPMTAVIRHDSWVVTFLN